MLRKIDILNFVSELSQKETLKLFKAQEFNFECPSFSWKKINHRDKERIIYSRVENGIRLYREALMQEIGCELNIDYSPQNEFNKITDKCRFFSTPTLNYEWDENRIVKFMLKISDEYKDPACFRIKSMFMRKYAELAIHYNGIIEYRRYKMLGVEVEVTEGGEYSECIWITQHISDDQIREKMNRSLKRLLFKIHTPLAESSKIESLKSYEAIPCLALSNVAAAIIHEAVGHISEADIFNGTLENEYIVNSEVALNTLTVTDYARHESCVTQYYYDDSGICCEDVEIISKGKWKGVISDMNEWKSPVYKIKGFERSSIDTGCSLIRMRNLVMKEGQYSRQELITCLGNGIILSEIIDSQLLENESVWIKINGFFVEEGKIISKFENLELKSTFLEVISSVKEIGKFVHWKSLYSCTKYGEVAYVSSGTPDFICAFKIS